LLPFDFDMLPFKSGKFEKCFFDGKQKVRIILDLVSENLA